VRRVPRASGECSTRGRSRRRSTEIKDPGQLARDRAGNVVGKADMRAQLRQVGENVKAALLVEVEAVAVL
jgi:hypothetical protein